MQSIIGKAAIVKTHTEYLSGEVAISIGKGAIKGHSQPVLKSET